MFFIFCEFEMISMVKTFVNIGLV